MKMTSEVVKYVEKRLKQEWSPEEISGCIEREIGTKVSHERIHYIMIGLKKLIDDCSDIIYVSRA